MNLIFILIITYLARLLIQKNFHYINPLGGWEANLSYLYSLRIKFVLEAHMWAQSRTYSAL